MTNKQKLDDWLLKYKDSLEDYRLIQSVITLNIMNTKRAYDRGEYELVREIKFKRSSLKNALREIECNLRNCKASIKRYGRLYSLECELSVIENNYLRLLGESSYRTYRVEFERYRSLKHKYHFILNKINFYRKKKKIAYERGNYNFISDYDIYIADLRIELKSVIVKISNSKRVVKYMADCLSCGLVIDSAYNDVLKQRYRRDIKFFLDNDSKRSNEEKEIIYKFFFK